MHGVAPFWVKPGLLEGEGFCDIFWNKILGMELKMCRKIVEVFRKAANPFGAPKVICWGRVNWGCLVYRKMEGRYERFGVLLIGFCGMSRRSARGW